MRFTVKQEQQRRRDQIQGIIMLADTVRAQALEEAARVAEDLGVETISKAIRALKAPQ